MSMVKYMVTQNFFWVEQKLFAVLHIALKVHIKVTMAKTPDTEEHLWKWVY